MESQFVVQDTSARFRTLNEAVHALISILNSFVSSLSNLPLQQIIRLSWIIGGYVLMRPYLELGFRKLFARKEDHSSPTIATTAPITAPSHENCPSDSTTDDSELRGNNVGTTAVSAGWGTAARKRRAMILHAWEEEDTRLAQKHDFDDIDPDLLED